MANASQTDSDGDGLLDGLEDANHNGLVDPGETSPTLADSDGDSFNDGDEILAGTDPTDPNSHPVNSAIPALGTFGSAALCLLLLGAAAGSLRRRDRRGRAARAGAVGILIAAHLLHVHEARATTITYLHADQLGSTRLGRTGGATTQEVVYLPFGNVQSQSGSALRH